MKISGLSMLGPLGGLVVAGLLCPAVAASADLAAGKSRFNAICAECHDSADFEGEDVRALTDTLGRISRGEMKHKKSLSLSSKEIADVAAYMSSGGK